MSHFIDKEESWFTEWFQHMVTIMGSSVQQERSAFRELGDHSDTDDAPTIYCTTNLYQNAQFPLLYIQKNPGVFRNQKLSLRIDMILRTVYEGGSQESLCIMKLRKIMNEVYSCTKTFAQAYFEPKHFSYKITDKKIREVLMSYDAAIFWNATEPIHKREADPNNDLDIPRENALRMPFLPQAISHLKLFLQNPDPWGRNTARSILPISSARYCKQTLFTAPAVEHFYTAISHQRETYHLNQDPLAYSKYHTIIQCQDHSPPAFSKLVPDQEVWVYSAIPMREEIIGNTPLKLRYCPVPNSILFHDEEEKESALHNNVWDLQGKTITYTRNGIISYTPIMHMKVQKLTLSCKESESIGPWSLELREI